MKGSNCSNHPSGTELGTWHSAKPNACSKPGFMFKLQTRDPQQDLPELLTWNQNGLPGPPRQWTGGYHSALFPPIAATKAPHDSQTLSKKMRISSSRPNFRELREAVLQKMFCENMRYSIKGTSVCVVKSFLLWVEQCGFLHFPLHSQEKTHLTSRPKGVDTGKGQCRDP